MRGVDFKDSGIRFSKGHHSVEVSEKLGLGLLGSQGFLTP